MDTKDGKKRGSLQKAVGNICTVWIPVRERPKKIDGYL